MATVTSIVTLLLLGGIALLRGVIHLALGLLLVITTLLLRGSVALLLGIVSLATLLLAAVVVRGRTAALGWG
jgi:hypothetical protein